MSAQRKDYEQAVVMYEKGFSIGQIANYYNVTRQAMHKILARRGVVFRENTRNGKENHFFRGGATQDERATQLYILALEKGIIKRSDSCEECGAPGRTEGHHDSYNKPLEVRWLCHKCHYEWHKTNTADPAQDLPPKKTRQEVSSMGGKSSRKKK